MTNKRLYATDAPGAYERAIRLAARFSRRSAPLTTLFVCNRLDAARALRRRFRRAGGALPNLAIVTGDDGEDLDALAFPRDAERLRTFADLNRAGLIVIDTLAQYLGDFRAPIEPVLLRLDAAARDARCPILLVGPLADDPRQRQIALRSEYVNYLESQPIKGEILCQTR